MPVLSQKKEKMFFLHTREKNANGQFAEKLSTTRKTMGIAIPYIKLVI